MTIRGTMQQRIAPATDTPMMRPSRFPIGLKKIPVYYHNGDVRNHS